MLCRIRKTSHTQQKVKATQITETEMQILACSTIQPQIRNKHNTKTHSSSMQSFFFLIGKNFLTEINQFQEQTQKNIGQLNSPTSPQAEQASIILTTAVTQWSKHTGNPAVYLPPVESSSSATRKQNEKMKLQARTQK